MGQFHEKVNPRVENLNAMKHAFFGVSEIPRQSTFIKCKQKLNGGHFKIIS